MKVLFEKHLVQKNRLCLKSLLLGLIIILSNESKAQIVNYVNNPSFESLTSSTVSTSYNVANYWQPIDTNKYSYYLYSTLPQIASAPYCQQGFQKPRTGNNFIAPPFYCANCPFTNSRGYPRNRLKQKLITGETYCAKYYVVNTNNSPIAIDSYGIYFSNSLLDTIKYCSIPLTYLSPQIQYNSSIITDTLNWVPITGTFVANGDEKYMVLGNFKSNLATNTLLINPTYSATLVNDIYIDDVSCVNINLPAYAGADKYVNFGDSVFLGRQPDVGIDEACMWFQLPTVITPTPPLMDTVAGLWVKPVVTTTYVVRQQLWCSGVKYDTVVVYMNALGLKGLQIADYKFQIWPNPADNVLVTEALEATTDLIKVQIYNNLGQLIKEDNLQFKNKRAEIRTTDLPNGVYLLLFKNSHSETSSKRFVINR